MSDVIGALIGKGIDRVDGPLKVTGRAPYAGDVTLSHLAYAVLVQSTVAAGQARVSSVAARNRPGVIAVLSYRNAQRLPDKGRGAINPPAGRTLSLLQDETVHYNGEPLAVVVAETYEQAVDGASYVQVDYQPGKAALDFAREKSAAYKPAKLTRGGPDNGWGDADAGLGEAEARVDQVYSTPQEHHNPMEPHATVAHWEGDNLTLYDATQYVSGVKNTVAKVMGIPAERIRVIDPYVGGGFGGKGSAWSHVVLAAMAARMVHRPVKLVLARPQMFGPVGSRPQTEQRLVLGARRDGALTALRHDVLSHTSVMEDYAEPATEPTRALYACPNVATTQRLVKLNVGVPTFQRAPGEATGTFAIESAMDELAMALNMDPVALRLKNYAEKDPQSGKPWTSKRLRECYALAAERFGWARRNPVPRSMSDGRWLIGWGMATATYPAHRMPAKASARLLRDGSALVRSGTHDLGTGTYTIMTQVAAETLGLPVQRVRFELGDTTFPEAPVSGGSMTAGSVGPAVLDACQALRQRLAEMAVGDPASPLHGMDPAGITFEDGAMLSADRSRSESLFNFAQRQRTAVEAAGQAKPDEKSPYTSRSFGAVFAEVRVHSGTGVLRVPRVVAAYSVGRLLNEKTARSQLQGGIVWGISQALFEDSVLDTRYGRFANGNFAEYHVPVNADVHGIDVQFVEENDTLFNPLGARGVGEIGITGVAAALANAAYHATGRRVRDLPITLDKLA